MPTLSILSCNAIPSSSILLRWCNPPSIYDSPSKINVHNPFSFNQSTILFYAYCYYWYCFLKSLSTSVPCTISYSGLCCYTSCVGLLTSPLAAANRAVCLRVYLLVVSSFICFRGLAPVALGWGRPEWGWWGPRARLFSRINCESGTTLLNSWPTLGRAVRKGTSFLNGDLDACLDLDRVPPFLGDPPRCCVFLCVRYAACFRFCSSINFINCI